jgi:hypothetical protein
MHQIHLTAHELRRLFEPVLPFAGSDDLPPVLTGVHLVTRGDYLVAEATDRFALAVNRLQPQVGIRTEGGQLASASTVARKSDGKVWSEWDEGWTRAVVPAGVDVLIPASLIRRALAFFRAPKRAHIVPVVTLEISESDRDEPLIEFKAEGLLEDDVRRQTMQARTLDGTFPKVRDLLAEAIADDEQYDGNAGFNPNLLVRFQRAANALVDTRHEGIHWRFRGPAKPILGFIGDDFVGLLMPRRMFGDYDPKNPLALAFPDRKGQWVDFLQN